MKIYLFCNLGLSTSILVDSMMESATKKGMEIEVKAYPISELSTYAQELDAALLGPQVGYRLKEAKSICDKVNVPVGAVPMQAYGMCDGEAVLEFALNLINGKE